MGSQSRKTILHLPDDLMSWVFSKLPLCSRWAARSVCKGWRAILSPIPLGEAEDYIIVNAVDHILLFNVTLSRWMKPLPLTSIPLPVDQLKDPYLCAVFEELFFFRDRSMPPRIATWNAITNECRVMREAEPVPGVEREVAQSEMEDGRLLFGAYRKPSGEMILLLYNYFGWPEGYLYRWSSGESRWREVPLPGNIHGPNFNHRKGLVTFVDDDDFDVQVYDVEKDVFQLLDAGAEKRDGFYRLASDKFTWMQTLCGARFYFHGLGLFVIGDLKDEIFDGEKVLGVLSYDEGKGTFVVVSQSPPGLTRGWSFFSPHFCSDNEENIWVMPRDSSMMLQFNVVSRRWITLPSILDRFRSFMEEEPTCWALYTTLK